MNGPHVIDLLILGTTVYLLFRLEQAAWRASRHPNNKRLPTSDTPICPCCCLPISLRNNFCPKCQTPLTGYAATGPLESVAARGELLRRAVARPSRLVLTCLGAVVLAYLLLALGMLSAGWHGEALSLVLPTALFTAFLAKAAARYVSNKAGARPSIPPT